MKKTKRLLTLSVLALSALMLTPHLGEVSNSPSISHNVRRAWNYAESTDTVLDSFYENSDKRVLSATGAVDSGFSYAEIPVAGSTNADSAIYKYAGAVERTNSSVVLEMFIEEAVNLDGIKIAARGYTAANDVWSESAVKLTETIDSFGDTNTITKGQWIEVEIKFSYTFSGIKYPDRSVMASESVGGFALLNDVADNPGKILIRKVSFVEGSNVEEVDDFKRDGGKPESAYWGGVGDAGGVHVKRNVVLNGGSYTYKNGAAIDKDCAVINVKGDFSGAKVALVAADGTVGSYVNWANLKSSTGEALPTSSAEFASLDIDLAASGLTSEFAGISIESTSEMVINNFFASDCEVRKTELLMKALDVANATYYNDFNFEFEGTWPTEYGAAPSAAQERGIGFAVNWANAADVKVKDGALQLPGTSADYANIFFGLSKDPVVQDYMVMKVKLTDGATLDDFRFKLGSNEVLWHKDAYSEYGLKADASTMSPYYDAGTGYTYVVYNLAENKIDPAKVNGELQIYYGHDEGTIYIDEIFFADAKEKEIVDTSVNADFLGTPSADGYMYAGWVAPGSDFYTMTITAGEGGAKLSNFRLQQEGVTDYLWLKDGKLIGVDGEPIADREIPAGESVTLTIDLAASGYSASAGGHFHSFWSEYDPAVGGTGAITVTNAGGRGYKTYTRDLLEAPIEVSKMGEYTYVGYAYGGGSRGEIMRIKITSETAQDNALGGVRLEMGGKVWWFDNSQADRLIGTDGNPLSVNLAAGENIIEIDLEKTGIDPNAISDIHIHGTDDDPANALAFTINQISYVRRSAFVSMEGKATPDYAKPTVTLSTNKTEATVGDEITITSSATDETSAADKVTTELKVSYGSGDDVEEVTVTDGKFTASKAGVYTITFTATDEAGNSEIKTVQVSVSEPAHEHAHGSEWKSDGNEHWNECECGDKANKAAHADTDGDEKCDTCGYAMPKEDKQGLSGGQIALIVIGSVVGVGIIGAVIYFIIKRRK